MRQDDHAGPRCRLLVAVVALLCLCGLARAAEQGATGAALDQLLQEDPTLSDLAERDPALLELLRERPEMVNRLAAAPSLMERVLDTFATPWVLFGLGAQFLFMMRFLVQWIASERKQRSHVPVIFWYFSIGGGLMLLTYAIHRRDPVFILGQALGLLIYTRNLVLIYRRAWAYRELLADRAERHAAAAATSGESGPAPTSEPAPAT